KRTRRSSGQECRAVIVMTLLRQQRSSLCLVPESHERWAPCCPRGSIHGLRVWKLPCAVQNLSPRTIQAHGVIPTLHDWQAVRNFPIAALLSSEIVDGVSVEGVFLEVSLGVVEAD